MGPMTNNYVAPITLGFTPADGDLIGGTVNGVEVNGEWTNGKVELYEGTIDVSTYRAIKPSPVCSVIISRKQAMVVVEQDSAPTTDYELHLYRYTPAAIVQIPQEYVEGLEATAADATAAKTTAETAQSTANSAKTTAETAQTTANAAKTTAETAQSTADEAKTAAETAQSTANAAKTAAETAVKPVKNSNNTCDYDMYNPYADYKPTRTYIGTLGGSALSIIVNEKHPSVAFVPPTYLQHQADFEFRRATSVYPHPLITGIGGIIMHSSTAGSTKKFKITVDDTGAISATEVTT